MNLNDVIDIVGERTDCPYCGRAVRVDDKGRFRTHAKTAGARNDTCPMAGEHVPITGHSDNDYFARAHLISKLAWRVRDEDPQQVWNYLTVLPAEEVQRLLMLALAAIPVDQTVEDMFAWVCDLPAAREAEAAGQ